jgi:hypothetical protein
MAITIMIIMIINRGLGDESSPCIEPLCVDEKPALVPVDLGLVVLLDQQLLQCTPHI